MKEIGVVGAGAGGLIFSSKLAKKLSRELREGKISITVFDRARNHEFQPGYLAAAFRGENPARLRRPLKSLVHRMVKLVPENCESVDLDNREITTEKSHKKFSFDRIVLAPGCSVDKSLIPGLSGENMDFHTSALASSRIYARLKKFKEGKIVTGVGGLPYKCPPSPNESAFMLDEFFSRRNLRKRVQITFVTPYLRAYPAETISRIISPLYRERNIEVVTGFNLDSVDSGKKQILSMEGESVDYDELMLVPPHAGVEMFRGAEYADEDGWIKTDKRDMHVIGHDDAFAIGDATNIPISKAGVEAHLQGIIVAENMASEMYGTGESFLFTGRTHCSMETGYHQATFVVGTYEKPVKPLIPTTMRYLEKKFMERIYWSSLKGGYERLFKLYFGEDYYSTEPAEEKKEVPAGVHGTEK